MNWLRAERKAFGIAVLAGAVMLARKALAEELRDFCPDRPGVGTPACTIDPGHFAAELGVVDLKVNQEPNSHEETITMGDLLLRYGVNDNFEVQLGWTSFGHNRTWDASTGVRARATGTGDLRIAVRQNLHNADGGGLSIALMPYVTVPIGTAPLGATEGGSGLLVPFSYELPRGLKLCVTAQVDAAPDEDGIGNHLAYSGILGLDVSAFDVVTTTFELIAAQDRDPSGHSSNVLVGVSAGWMAARAFQVDAGVNIGLTRDVPDMQLYMGLARRF